MHYTTSHKASDELSAVLLIKRRNVFHKKVHNVNTFPFYIIVYYCLCKRKQ